MFRRAGASAECLPIFMATSPYGKPPCLRKPVGESALAFVLMQISIWGDRRTEATDTDQLLLVSYFESFPLYRSSSWANAAVASPTVGKLVTIAVIIDQAINGGFFVFLQ